MIKEDLYVKKFALLQPWIGDILTLVKKEIKSEHLRKDGAFMLQHFPKKTIDKISLEELIAIYSKEVGHNEQVGEWIASRWILKHGEVYHFFAERLKKINPKFDEIAEIPATAAQELIKEGSLHFGAKAIYIFSILNAVMFSSNDFAALRSTAEKEKSPVTESAPVELSKDNFENELRKLKEKYEKKVLGLEAKYIRDTEGLRKQIGQLQKRVGELSRV